MSVASWNFDSAVVIVAATFAKLVIQPSAILPGIVLNAQKRILLLPNSDIDTVVLLLKKPAER